ncbi:S9 family peptidase [Corallococcus sp. H22C18031201]|uniref:prolyl oligopeptidase family serine peptidase n=1 Tax=Citreicoccus inhibens TaxID=2849499 RepID=UPI000E7260D4|nr:prolyl oligopeptidase family serine peptidase [Citreicoccus inhibens]MBU8898173.1 prolyl oligopeptidase family serine peptidase [Citreicoccus inhibens]RJS18136.1 S9 family peptidase [Corallococcus sp. H22C18031201]
MSLAACATTQEAAREAVPASASADARPAVAAARSEEVSRMAYPHTPSQPIVDTVHGVQVADPYRWLEDEKSPEVQAWMKAENEQARAALAQMPGRDALARRFRELYYVDSMTAPLRRANRYFYFRTHKDKEKAILYWRDGEAGAEKVLLDPNGWSKDGTVSLGTWVPSWDGKRVVFAQRPNAADEAVLHVLDVDSGEWSKVDVIEGAKYAGPHWTPDGKGFYYEWLPTDPSIPVDARPGYTTLRFHQLGQDPKNDALVHPRTGDPTTFLQGDLSRDGKFLFAYVIRGWSENDVYWKHPGEKDWRLLVKGQGAKYTVLAWKDRFYVTTDEGAPRQRVFVVNPTKPERAAWRELVAEDPAASLESTAIVGGHLTLEYLRDAATEVRLATLEGKPVRTVQLPGVGAASNLLGQEDSDEAYFSFSSFTTPRQVYKTSVASGKVSLWSRVEMPMDPDAYTVEQVFYPSKDGTRVPMFVVYRKGLKRDGTAPTLLYGYGGFFVSMQPAFRSNILPWLDAGGVYAVANLRGGGEYGKAWHDAGRLANKQNVFDDFHAAAEYLAREHYTQPSKLAIYGGSNGGLLVGAAMTQRPELYGAAVCAVPLLDMVRYHLFGSGRTWTPEYGSAEDAAQFKTLYAYSPYHHVRPDVRYPALLMMSADHDDRVDPLHARKFVAAMQAAPGNTSPVLLRIEANSGHQGSDQVAKAIESSADMYAFLFQALGVKAPAAGVAVEGH